MISIRDLGRRRGLRGFCIALSAAIVLGPVAVAATTIGPGDPGRLLGVTPQRTTSTSWLAPDAVSGRDLLYVSVPNSYAVEVFSRADPARWVGQLKDSYSPSRLLVDAQNNLWVTNLLGSVWMFEPGHLKPSRKYTQGLLVALSVAVAGDGTVYVLNGTARGTLEIVEYAPGSETPTVKIPLRGSVFSFSSFALGGIELDAAGNLYAGYVTLKGDQIAELPSGSVKPHVILSPQGISGIENIAFDPSGNFVVCSFAAVAVFARTSPIAIHVYQSPFLPFVYPEQVVFGADDVPGDPRSDVLMYAVDAGPGRGIRLDYTTGKRRGRFATVKPQGGNFVFGIALSADAQR